MAWLTGLSARLLVLTIFFVMLSEVFIYAPSVGRYRLVYLEERVAAAHLAGLALDVPATDAISEPLREELLDHARSRGIVLRRPDSKMLILSGDIPESISATYDLRQKSFFPLIWEAFMTLGRSGPYYIRIIAESPKSPDILVETIVDEAPMRAEMFDYSGRILALSIFISVITASLVYLSLHLLFVRPMQGITQSMVTFRGDPEGDGATISPGGRRDEIGRAERELADMQHALRAALRQRHRLAQLGIAVTKINHDLRNILATAQLLSDRVGMSDDPDVRRVAPSLLAAIDRAAKLCSETLRFAHEGAPAPDISRFDLAALVEEIDTEMVDPATDPVSVVNGIATPLTMAADRDQLYRVLANLILNAGQAGARHVAISASADNGVVHIEIADDGPGLPDAVQKKLFEPFTGAGRSGGTGLGLAIARDLMHAHGGEIEMVRTGSTGTVFRLTLPEDLSSLSESAPETPLRV